MERACSQAAAVPESLGTLPASRRWPPWRPEELILPLHFHLMFSMSTQRFQGGRSHIEGKTLNMRGRSMIEAPDIGVMK